MTQVTSNTQMTEREEVNPTISLQEIKKFNPCTAGWKKALTACKGDLDARLSLGDIATNNGSLDAMWCLRCFNFSGKFQRAVVDKVVTLAIKRIKQWQDISIYAADAAAYDAAYAAYDAAYAAYDAAAAAAYDAAYDAAAAAAAYDAAAAAFAAAAAELEQQKQDIIAAFPPVFFTKSVTTQ